ncbi:MAG: hypothetical protein IRZ03_19185 [Acidobacterium ailaaui]|nr:hypothetical protein [Pseudacidobacterium ailaaui]
MEKKRQQFDIKLNSIQDTDNPTRKEVEFILHDFELNHNNSIISKETALKTLHTLKDMPIVCKYYPVSEPGANDDALGSHEVVIGESRDTGDPIIEFNTIPIGVFTEPAYITTITDDNGNEKEVVAGKGILWASRFPNVIGLLKEWYDNGVDIVSSMEILYDSYLFKDGVEEILSYVYEGHCVLNSETRGNHEKVYPAYDSSKLTRLVAQAIGSDIKEGEKMENFQKVFELSHDDIRAKLYQKLDPELEKGTYSWIVDIYDEYFIVNLYNFDQKFNKFFRYNYTKTDNDVTIDFESKTEVMEERKWVEVEQVQQLQNQLQEKEQELEDYKNQLNEIKEQLDSIKTEKENIQSQFNKASEQVIELTEKVKELTPFKEKFEKAEFEKTLEEKKSFYSAKFAALNATDKFESEEVQDLIQKAVYENEEGHQAVFELNSMLLDLIQVKEENTKEPNTIREMASKRSNLIPEDDDFDSKYSL